MSVHAVVISSEVQYVGGRSSKRYLGHTVDLGTKGAYAVLQWGARGAAGSFQVHPARTVSGARSIAARKLAGKVNSGYRLVEDAVQFSVHLSSPALTADSADLRVLADAYDTARRDKNRTVIDAITAAPHSVGPWSVVALPGFAREVKSEPVPQAIDTILGQIPSATTRAGDTVLLLPEQVAWQVTRACHGAVATRSPVGPEQLDTAVLDTTLSLWEPGGDSELAELSTAFDTALLLAG